MGSDVVIGSVRALGQVGTVQNPQARFGAWQEAFLDLKEPGTVALLQTAYNRIPRDSFLRLEGPQSKGQRSDIWNHSTKEPFDTVGLQQLGAFSVELRAPEGTYNPKRTVKLGYDTEYGQNISGEAVLTVSSPDWNHEPTTLGKNHFSVPSGQLTLITRQRSAMALPPVEAALTHQPLPEAERPEHLIPASLERALA